MKNISQHFHSFPIYRGRMRHKKIWNMKSFLLNQMKDLLLDRWESSKYEGIVQNMAISSKTKAISFFFIVKQQWCSPCNMTVTYKWDQTCQFKWKQTKLIDRVILVFSKLVADKNTIKITNETTNTTRAFKALSNIYNGAFLWK